MREFDAIVVGSGPNGLAAACALASWGFSVRVYESQATVGGGLRTRQFDEAGFLHDECSAIHPMGYLSPFFRSLELQEHGLSWCSGQSSVAHPLDDGPAAILCRDPTQLGERLGPEDADAWARLFAPFAPKHETLLRDLLGPLSLFPRDPLTMLRFGLLAMRPAHSLARAKFRSEPARALFAGLAAHSILPLEHKLTAAFGLIFGTTAHVADWPCARGGSQSIADALASKFRSLGGEIVLNHPVDDVAALPESRVVLCDVAPLGLSRIASGALPRSYQRKLLNFDYGPAVYKVDYTLDGPIPWRDPAVGEASTVHVGGTHEQIAASEKDAWEGRAPSKPYLIVCQQSRLDPSRAPADMHTGYAYCHVPRGFEGDATSAIEAQLERFAPDFRDLVRTRHVTTPRDLQRLNPNYVGGAITGGAATLGQLFSRPVRLFDPYSTPNPRLFICSASTPPGGGVHGMCGYHAARCAARRLGKAVPRDALLAPLG